MMKNYLTFLLLLVFTITYSQDSGELTVRKKQEESKEKKRDKVRENYFQTQLKSLITNKYRNISKKKGEDKKNDSIIIQKKLLNTRLTEAFNQVVFSNSDLVDNASAFGVTQNEEKATVSVSTNFLLCDKTKNQFYGKVGINAIGSGSLINLYSNNEWQNSVGGDVGFIYKFSGSSFFSEKDIKKKYNKVLRKSFITDSIMKEIVELDLKNYQELRKSYKDSIKKALILEDVYNEENDTIRRNKIKKDFKELKRMEALFMKIEKNIRYPKEKDKEQEKLDFSTAENESIKINNDNIIKYILAEFWKKNNEIGKEAMVSILKEVAYVYDKKNIKSTGYTFWWLDGDFKLNNNTFNFSEAASNIKSDVLTRFNDSVKEKTGINKANATISVNINYTRNRSKFAYYLKGGLKFNSGSFLNSNLVNGTAKVSELIEDEDYLIKDEEGFILGEFSKINKTLLYGSFDVYGSCYFGKKKIVGANLSLSHNYSIKTPDGSSYRNNYTVLIGPTFRKPKKDDDTGLTFGLDFGFDNARYDKGANNNFVARIRVGIPFNLYNINK